MGVRGNDELLRSNDPCVTNRHYMVLSLYEAAAEVLNRIHRRNDIEGVNKDDAMDEDQAGQVQHCSGSCRSGYWSGWSCQRANPERYQRWSGGLQDSGHDYIYRRDEAD